MATLKWFIVLAGTLQGHNLDAYADRLAGFEFSTRAECLATARTRAAILDAQGADGRYMCMTPGMPDDELARQPKFDF